MRVFLMLVAGLALSPAGCGESAPTRTPEQSEKAQVEGERQTEQDEKAEFSKNQKAKKR